jgi:hypothetical protein
MTNRIRSVISVVLAAGLVMSLLTLIPILTPDIALAKLSTSQDQTGHVEKSRIAGKVANAQWYSEDKDVYSEGFIYLIDAESKPEGYYTDPIVVVQVWQYKLTEECVVYPDGEVCFYDYEVMADFYGYAEPQKSDFSISGNLRSASIEGVEVTGYDYVSGSEKTITLDASWTASGSLYRQKLSDTQYDEDYVYSFKAMGVGRDATVTAEISGDIDLTLDESEYLDSSATILKAKQAYMIRTVHTK